MTSLAVLVASTGSLAQEEPLSALDARATEGAAAGYVDDAVCGRCHADLYAGYQHVGMARSFRRAGNAEPIEDFGREYYHAPSLRYYQVLQQEAGLLFRRYQRDKDGREINAIDIPVAWVMGSGNRARSYLYQTDWGELFLLPVSWYSESNSWGMSPGFEAGNHPGLTRQIERECMFCHNAYPEVPSGSDVRYQTQVFPQLLPEGTGCQRCHGPGAGHIETVLEGAEINEIRDAIVNPARLAPEQRDAVCFQCHMLPSASVVGSRRFGRPDYSFRPGEKLTDYLVHMDVSEQGVDDADRFEINHHGYRLLQSQCFRQSEGALGCISCHDPHVKPDSAAFRAGVGEICADCHENATTLHTAETALSSGQCVDCHMPTRRTRDVVEVTMTDHRIARGPFDPDALVAPMQKENAALSRLDILALGHPPTGNEAETYRMLALLKAGRGERQAQQRLGEIVPLSTYADATPLIELATAKFNAGEYPAAESMARQAIEAGDALHAAYKILGVSLMAQNIRSESVDMLKKSLEIQRDPEVHFNLAAAYLRYDNPPLAEEQLDLAIELRPYMAVAWKYKALIAQSRGDNDEARSALVRSLALEPRDLSVYQDLVNLLRAMGDFDEADRYIELATRVQQTLTQ